MRSRSAFTLLEMSVVLAIIGLLAGGIMLGSNLIRQQQVMSVLEEATTYAHAIYQFKDKYGELPGDFDRATSIWGSDLTYCTSGLNATGGTCNGNGNGIIDCAGSANVTAEDYQVWKQLQLAGLITGSYTGANGPAGTNYDTVPGTNSPVSAIKNATFWVYGYWGSQTDNGTFYTGNYTNAMIYGTRVPGQWPYSAAFTGKEAYQLDQKYDDALPAFGDIRTLSKSWYTGSLALTCPSSDTGTAAVYSRSTTSAVCILLFMNTFGMPNPGQ